MSPIDQKYLALLNYARTKEERDELIELLTILDQSLVSGGEGALEHTLTQNIPQEIADALKEVMTHSGLARNGAETRALLKDLVALLNALPLLKMDLACRPTEEMIAHLYGWVGEHVGAGTVMDIGYDASLIGGARISYNGRYKEVTLAQAITAALSQERKDLFTTIGLL